ncbi:MAG: hypothetical protein MUF87_19950 [Anaerolineae bacterium]|nr:hypothetical protein [Anaerolineae bacterium]
MFRWQGDLFKPQKRVPVERVMVWEHGQREPWCLVTHDRMLTAARYAHCMWQEQGFWDLKSGPWESSHLRHPERMERYLLVLTFAYAWMLTLGNMSAAGSTPQYIGRRLTHEGGLIRLHGFGIFLRSLLNP